MYGEERLIQIVKRSRNLSLDNFMKRIITSVRRFANGTMQSDDITILMIRNAGV